MVSFIKPSFIGNKDGWQIHVGPYFENNFQNLDNIFRMMETLLQRQICLALGCNAQGKFSIKNSTDTSSSIFSISSQDIFGELELVSTRLKMAHH